MTTARTGATHRAHMTDLPTWSSGANAGTPGYWSMDTDRLGLNWRGIVRLIVIWVTPETPAASINIRPPGALSFARRRTGVRPWNH